MRIKERTYTFSNGETESDLAGILIYQSTERDANEGRARFTAVESRFTIFENSTKYETAPMFYVTNTKVDIVYFRTSLAVGHLTSLSSFLTLFKYLSFGAFLVSFFSFSTFFFASFAI